MQQPDEQAGALVLYEKKKNPSNKPREEETAGGRGEEALR